VFIKLSDFRSNVVLYTTDILRPEDVDFELLSVGSLSYRKIVHLSDSVANALKWRKGVWCLLK
jgi:hypothetical protein